MLILVGAKQKAAAHLSEWTQENVAMLHVVKVPVMKTVTLPESKQPPFLNPLCSLSSEHGISLSQVSVR